MDDLEGPRRTSQRREAGGEVVWRTRKATISRAASAEEDWVRGSSRPYYPRARGHFSRVGIGNSLIGFLCESLVFYEQKSNRAICSCTKKSEGNDSL